VRVTVTRRGTLAPSSPAPGAAVREVVDLADGSTAADLVRACGLDARACVVVAGGAILTRGAALRDGDQVQLYPHLTGG
jgi:sulfur carrier protein ThiS